MASLLLRLFHSDYFSPHLALSYLKTYSVSSNRLHQSFISTSLTILLLLLLLLFAG